MNLDPIGWNMAYLGLTTIVVWSVSRYYRRKVDFTKLKKYLDLKEKNLEQEFEKKIQTLNDASIHIDVDAKRYNQLTHVVQGDLLTIEKRLSMFAEIDKRIEGKLDIFRREEDRLRALSDEFAGQIREVSERRDDFRKLQKDLKKGEDRLAELEQASARFIQELKDVHAREQAALEARLEKEVLAARSEAEERLAALRQSLDTEVRGKAEAILEETRAQSQRLSTEVEGELARLGERTLVLSGEIESSREEILQQNAHVSETILKDLVGKVQEYQRTLGEDLQSQHDQAARRLAELDALVVQAEARVVSAADAKLADIQGGLSQFEARLESGAKETSLRYEEIQQGLLRESREALDALRRDLAEAATASARNDERLEAIEERAARLDGGVAAFEKNLGESLSRQAGAWDRLVAERIQQVEQGLHPRLRELEDRAAAAFDAFTAAEKKNLDLVIREAETGARDRLDRLDRDCEAAESNLEQLRAKAEARLEQSALESLESEKRLAQIEAKSGSLEAGAAAFEKKISDALVRQSQEWDRLVADRVQQVERGLLPRLRELEERAAAGLEAFVLSEKKNFEGALREGEKGARETLERLDRAWAESDANLKSLDEQFFLLRDAMDRAEKQLDVEGWVREATEALREEAQRQKEEVASAFSALETRAKRLETALDNGVAERTEAAVAQLGALRADFDRADAQIFEAAAKADALEKAAEGLEAQRARFEGELSANFEATLGELLSRLKTEENRLKGDYEKAADHRKKELLLAFEETANEYRALFQNGRGRADQKIDRLLAEMEQRLDRKVAAWQEEQLPLQQASLDRTVTAFVAEFRSRLEGLDFEAAAYRDQTRAQLETRLGAEVEAFARQAAAKKEGFDLVASEILALKGHLDETRSAVDSDAEALRADLRGRQDGWLREEHALRADFQKAFEARLSDAADRFNAEVLRKEGELARLADQWKHLEAVRKDFEKRLDKWNQTMVRGEKTLEEVSRRFGQKAAQVEGEVLGARESARVQMAAAVEALKTEAKAEVRRAAELQVVKVERRLEAVEADARRASAEQAEAFGKSAARQQKDLERLAALSLDREKTQQRDLEARKARALEFYGKVEEEQKKIHQVVGSLPEQFRREIRETLERERAGLRGEIGQFGREIRLEAERRLGEAASAVLGELEREKLDLRKAFEQLAQYAQQDRDIFQNRLIQYRAELEENIRHLLDRGQAPQGAGSAPMLSFDAAPAALSEGQIEGAKGRWHEELSAVDERIKTLSLKKDRRYELIEEQMKDAFGKVEKRLGQFNHRMDEAEQKVEKRAKRRFLIFLERLKQSADKTVAESGRKQALLEELQATVTERLAELEDWSKEHRAREGELLGQFEREAARLRGELQASCARFLDDQKTVFNQAMEAATERRGEWESGEDQARAAREKALSQAMEQHAASLSRFLEEQAAAVEKAQANLERLEAEYGSQSAERFAQQEKRLDAFILEKERSVDGGLAEMRERLALETEDRFKAVNEQIRVILEKVDLFLGQTDLFKKVDALQERLSSDLEAYEQKVVEIRGHLDNAVGFEEKIESFRRLETEVREGMENLADKQKTLGRMEDQLVYLVKMAEDLKTRGDILEGRRTELVRAEETLARHLGEAQRLGETFKGFLGIKNEIDEVLGSFSAVRKQASEARNLQTQLTGQIEASAGLQGDVDRRMAALEEKSMVIANQQGRLVEFKNRFDQLDMAFQDMEQRQNVLNRARGELAAEKEELQTLRDQVEREIETWRGMIENSPKPAAAPVAARKTAVKGENMTRAQTAQVADELHKLDWTPSDIADHLQIDEKEVRRLLGSRAARGVDPED